MGTKSELLFPSQTLSAEDRASSLSADEPELAPILVNTTNDVSTVFVELKSPPRNQSAMAPIVQMQELQLHLIALMTLLYVASIAVVLAVYFRLETDPFHTSVFTCVAAVSFVGLVLAGWFTSTHVERDSQKTECVSHALEMNGVHEQTSVDESSGTIETQRRFLREKITPARPRIHELDYLKFAVNVLVIYHHLMDQARGDHRKPHVLGFSYWDPAYANIIEPFVMQAAAFASGVVFSPKLTVNSARTFLSLGAGYWFLQTMYLLIHYLIDTKKDGDVLCCGEIPNMTFYMVLEMGITPFKHLWYIWALLCWRMLIPYWMQFQHPFFGSLALGVAVGFIYVDPSFMVYRVIYYFPYFVAGTVVQQKWLTQLFQFISTKRVKVWAWCMLIGSLWAFVYTYTIGMKPQCVFFMKWSYVTMHHETVNNVYGCGKDATHSDDADRYWINMWSRVASYPIGFILTLSLLAIMPSENSVIQRAGQRTLGPYCFHPLARLFLRAYWPVVYSDWKPEHFVPYAVVCLCWILILYHPIAHDICRWLVMPPLETLGMLKKA